MADEQDPPRKFYQLKPKEFDRVNAIAPAAASPPSPAAPPAPSAPATPPASAVSPSQRIDLHDIIRQGVAGVPLHSGPQAAGQPNDVQEALRLEYEHQRTAGLFHVEAAADKVRRRRIRNFWLAVTLGNAPFTAIAWAVNPTRGMGHASAIVFVCAVAGIAMFTAVMIWQTFCLRTER